MIFVYVMLGNAINKIPINVIINRYSYIYN